jgi:serine/threonine-protein kinase HipA
MSNRCLYCYLAIVNGEIDFHPSCSKKIFGTAVPPLMPYSEENLSELAEQIIKSQTTVTGVQPKLALYLASAKKSKSSKTFYYSRNVGELYFKTSITTLS